MSSEFQKEENLAASQPQKDDALFEALGKSKKRKKRRILRTVLIIVLILALILTAGISILSRRVRERFGSRSTEVESYIVDTGTISTLVSGSGMLMNEDTESLTVPDGVEVTDILVDYGDTVEEGELLALVDEATVSSALTALQSEIKALDSRIHAAEGDQAASYISAGVSGRVKVIYAEVGDKVPNIMVEHGALALLSLDGYLALELETEALSPGDSVTVRREDDSALEGTVKSAVGGRAVILVTDDGPRVGETVGVETLDGKALGSAVLTIHKPLAVTAYAGIVHTVPAKENAKVWAQTQLFSLKETSHTANYDTLLRERGEKEETLLELLKLRKYGGITAPIGGSVFSIADLEAEEPVSEIVVLSPDAQMSVTLSVDESDILALELGQEADVTVSSVSEDVFPGTVTEIDKTAADGAYTAVILLDKTEGMLQGMTADIDVKIRGVENAIIIPVAALHQTSTGAFVYTAYDEELQEYGGRVDVTTGLSNDNYVEITSGLQVGDTVYYTEAMSIFDMFAAAMGGGNRSGQTGSNRGSQPSGMPAGGQMPPSGGQRPGNWG